MKKEVQSVTEKVNYIDNGYLLSCEIVDGKKAKFKFYAGYGNGGNIYEPPEYSKERLETYIQMLTALSKSLNTNKV